MTGDRVAEIRGRVEALASSEGYGYLNADKAVKANAPADLAYLLETLDSWQALLSGMTDVLAARTAELEPARAKLAAVEGVVDMYGDLPGYGAILYNLRAALNQGGETNGE